TDEKIIGTWLDGSYIYQKTIDFGSLPNNGSKSVAHGISNLKRVINFSAIMQNTSSLDGRPIPIYAEGGNNIVSVEYNNTNINIYSSVDRRGRGIENLRISVTINNRVGTIQIYACGHCVRRANKVTC
ncbi:MAG: hypothetical protein K6F69_09205, partial [Treponema sp.]|nr:hypothetical protein [Treponema sp.]